MLIACWAVSGTIALLHLIIFIPVYSSADGEFECRKLFTHSPLEVGSNNWSFALAITAGLLAPNRFVLGFWLPRIRHDLVGSRFTNKATVGHCGLSLADGFPAPLGWLQRGWWYC